MSIARFLIALLFAAAVSADLAVLAWAGRLGGPVWPDVQLAVMFSLVFAQIGVVAVWAALGRSQLPWRAAGLIAAVVGFSAMLATTLPEAVARITTDDTWGLQFLLQAGWLAVVLIPARAYGLQLVGGPNKPQTAGLQRLQFGLSHLFAWLTATSIVLGLSKFTFDCWPTDLPLNFWQEVGLISAVNATLVLATLWVVLDVRSWHARLQTLGVTISPILPLLAIVLRDAGRDWMFALATMWLLEVVWLVLALFVVRTAGYRLTWQAVRPERRPAFQPGHEKTSRAV